MSLELITGEATESANGDVGEFFAGTVAPRRLKIDEALQDRATGFLQEAFAGRKSPQQVKEAFSTSDFTLAAFAQVDSEAQARYAELPSVWRQYTAVTTVNDFRPKRLYDRWSKNLGLKRVPELTEYPPGAGQAHSTNWINVAKFGLRDAISFEALINNEAIDELENIPDKYARAASETETINALSNYFNVDETTGFANGFNTSFFKAGNGNAVDNKPLTAANLDAALTALSQKKDINGRLTARPDLIVVIPSSLQWTMNKILALQEIRETAGATESIYTNFLTTQSYVVDPMLDVLNTAGSALTSWMIVPKPNAARPASFAAFLRGYENPDLRVKANQGTRIGGGAITPADGSFDVDDVQYRVRHIVGHQTGDPLFTYASTGQ